jgi:hypothetical protein
MIARLAILITAVITAALAFPPAAADATHAHGLRNRLSTTFTQLRAADLQLPLSASARDDVTP